MAMGVLLKGSLQRSGCFFGAISFIIAEREKKNMKRMWEIIWCIGIYVNF